MVSQYSLQVGVGFHWKNLSHSQPVPSAGAGRFHTRIPVRTEYRQVTSVHSTIDCLFLSMASEGQ